MAASYPKRNKPRYARKLARNLLIIAICFYGLLMLFEAKFIYFPTRYPQGDWAPWDQPAVTRGINPRIEDCYLTTSDGVKLHGWYATALTRAAALPGAVILWFHGNAGNITHRYDTIVELVQFPADVFIIDYRGYGRSEGKPSEKGLYRDAEASWNYLLHTKGIDPGQIVLLGRSLGGAVAIELAHRLDAKPAGLIIESSFTSVPDMARQVLPIVPGFMVRTKMNSIGKVGTITIPKLFVHSRSDEVIPFAHGQRLYERAREPKQFHSLEAAGHNETEMYGGQAYFRTLRRFVQSSVRSAQASPGGPPGDGPAISD